MLYSSGLPAACAAPPRASRAARDSRDVLAASCWARGAAAAAGDACCCVVCCCWGTSCCVVCCCCWGALLQQMVLRCGRRHLKLVKLRMGVNGLAAARWHRLCGASEAMVNRWVNSRHKHLTTEYASNRLSRSTAASTLHYEESLLLYVPHRNLSPDRWLSPGQPRLLESRLRSPFVLFRYSVFYATKHSYNMQRLRSSRAVILAVRLCCGQHSACTAGRSEGLPAAASQLTQLGQHASFWSCSWQPWAAGGCDAVSSACTAWHPA